MKFRLFILFILMLLITIQIASADLSLSTDTLSKDFSKIEFVQPIKDISKTSSDKYLLTDDVAYFNDKSSYESKQVIEYYDEIEYYDCKVDEHTPLKIMKFELL